jgi:carbamoyltransferase
MAYNIIGVNPGHNGSVALVSDGKLVYYIEEERLSRSKYDGNPFKGIMDIILTGFHIDEIVIGGTSNDLPKLPWTGEDPYTALVRKYFPAVKTTMMGHEHHASHAATAFYNSGFKNAIAIIVDGAGSYRTEKYGEEEHQVAEGFETESIWVCEFPKTFNLLHKWHGSNKSPKISTNLFDFDDAITITKAYEAVSQYLGFGYIEAGKTMGLAPYGKKDDNIPPLFLNGRGSKDVFIPNYPAGAFVDTARVPYLRQVNDPKEWHTDSSLLTDAEKNLAWKIQQDTQTLVGDLIEQVVNGTGIKQVVIAGGYGLNCVANYYFKKRFPDVEIYCEPIANDGGTAIGIAKLAWYNNEELANNIEDPQTTLYHGPMYSTDFIFNVIKNDVNFEYKEASYKDIIDLIIDRNIVALFQGRSEAGPRALGNRSIIYDPRDFDGKDHVNKVKGREWFRPFAGSVLKEDANDWFDMAGMDESPYMMYAVNVAADKLQQIPAVTHVDDTCRVQTVTAEQNLHYYNLIKEFKERTGVPVLFNTSFNLAGDPLVETIFDALVSLIRSEMKYLYLPELGILVTKKDTAKVDETQIVFNEE